MKVRGSYTRAARRAAGQGPDSRKGGFTLIETALATTVMMIALMSASAATLRMHTLRRQNREQVVAQNAMRSVAEQVHAVSGSQQGTENLQDWTDALTNAFGPGGTIGNTFNIPELRAIDQGTPIGSITIFTDETATDAGLGVDIGLPRDLNGDNVVDDTNVVDGVGSPARILPVMISVQWVGVTGRTRLDHTFYVLGY